MRFGKLVSVFVVIALLMVSLTVTTIMVGAQEPEGTPTEAVNQEMSPTVEETSVATVESTVTVTPTEEATVTVTPTVESTVTVTPTEEATATAPLPTETPVPTETPTPEPTPTVTPTVMITPTVVVTATAVPEAGATGDISTSSVQGRTTTVYVQNINNSAVNDTVVQWYNTGGTNVSNTTLTTIPAYGMTTVQYPGSGPFQGSAVVASSNPLAVIVEIVGESDGSMAAYTGVTAGARTIYLPAVHRSSWDCTIAVQNTGGSSTTVTLQIKDPSGNNMLSPAPTYSVPANSSVYINTNSFAAQLGSAFAGSAVVTSDTQDVVAVVLETWKTNTWTVAYMGFPASKATTDRLFFPVIHRNANGYDPTGLNSFIFVQNPNLTEARVDVQFKAPDGTVVRQYLDVPIPPQSAQSWSTINNMPTNITGFAGSAVVTVRNGVSVVGVADDYWQTGDLIRGTYGAVDYYTPSTVADGATYVYLPALKKHSTPGGMPSGFNNTIFVQNLGSQPAVVDMEYHNQDGSLRLTRTVNVAANGALSWIFVQNESSFPNGWGGSGRVISKPDAVNGNTAQPIVVVSDLYNQNWQQMDSMNYYTGIAATQ